MKRYFLLLIIFVSILGMNMKAQVSRDSAFTLLKKNVLSGKWMDKEIYSTIKPIPSLTCVQANNATVSPNYKSWFFFIDEMPYANWAHPCKYVFIDTSNGFITTMERRMPPLNMKNMDFLHRVRPLSQTIPGALFKIPYRVNMRNTGTTTNEYAVIISGGIDSYHNWE